MRDLADEPALEVAEVDVELAAARRRVAPRHVLPEDLHRLGALHEHRAQIANERREKIALRAIERVRAPHGVRFLAERPEQPADDLRLPVQVDEPLLERSRQAQVVVELELRLARQRLAERAVRRLAPVALAALGRAAARGCDGHGHQYDAVSRCVGSAARCTPTKKRLTFRSRRLSPT